MIMAGWRVRCFFILTLMAGRNEANLRCFSCNPCNELEWYAGDVSHFEQDCYLDRYCMKISGVTTDVFGYRREVSFRGCPWVSVFTRLEEGCTSSGFDVFGLGRVEGIVCFCSGHLCNPASAVSPVSFLAVMPLVLLRLLIS